MTTNEIICQAIRESIIIKFTYDGHPRIVEPFTLGIRNGTSTLILSAYLIGGYSQSNINPPWRAYDVYKIQNISLTNKKSESYRQGYNPNDSRMSSIICTR